MTIEDTALGINLGEVARKLSSLSLEIEFTIRSRARFGVTIIFAWRVDAVLEDRLLGRSFAGGHTVTTLSGHDRAIENCDECVMLLAM